MMEAQSTETRHKKTRAQIARDSVVIRLATDATGKDIAAILEDNDVGIPGADWSKIFPNWLIATIDDSVIGCIQVIPAKPVGYCEFLFVKQNLSFKIKAIAIRKLMLQAEATIKMSGSQFAACSVGLGNKKFVDVLKNIGSIRMDDHMMMVKKL